MWNRSVRTLLRKINHQFCSRLNVSHVTDRGDCPPDQFVFGRFLRSALFLLVQKRLCHHRIASEYATSSLTTLCTPPGYNGPWLPRHSLYPFCLPFLIKLLQTSAMGSECSSGYADPGCMRLQTFNQSLDCSASVTELWVRSDGLCYDGGDLGFYKAYCLQEGDVGGMFYCNTSSCEHCELTVANTQLLPTDGTCVTRPWGDSGADISLSLDGYCGSCLPQVEPGCLVEHLYEDNMCTQQNLTALIPIFADGACHPLHTGRFYQVECDQQGYLTGVSNCNSSSCKHCAIVDVSEVPSDGSCAARPWGNAGAYISFWFDGMCAACDREDDLGCLLEEMYQGANCPGQKSQLAILADGECHPLSNSRFYRTHCDDYGYLVGVANCNSSSCEHCDINVNEHPVPLESCSTRSWGDNGADISLRFHGTCAACDPDYDVGCFLEEVYDGAGCDDMHRTMRLAISADGNCNPISPGNFYKVNCDGDGYLVGVANCNSSSCEHCDINVSEHPVPLESCSTRSWGDNGADISLRFHGTCAACDPDYDVGCFLEEVYGGAGCDDMHRTMRLAISADGNCNPISPGNFYKVNCDGDGYLVGVANCNSSSCEHCDINVSEHPVPLESCSTRSWGDNGADISLRFHGTCAACDPDYDVGCFLEEVYDGAGCDDMHRTMRLAISADGNCNPISPGNFYKVNCDGDGYLVGVANCNSSSCEHCDINVSEHPVPLESCSTRSWGDNGADISLRFHGTCAACDPDYDVGCFLEEVYGGAGCDDMHRTMRLAISADGNCNPISPGNFYKVNCDGDGYLVGVANCNSSSCEHCDINVSEHPVPLESCSTRSWGDNGADISLRFHGTCAACDPDYDVGCFLEEVYGGAGCDDMHRTMRLAISADGNCNPISPGNFYKVNCDGDGYLVGVANCNSSSCEHCDINVSEHPVPLESCSTRSWGDNGADISLRFHGTCAACDPDYDVGCFLEEVYGGAGCDDMHRTMRLAISADGNCNPISPGNFYKVNCDGDGYLVGVANCNSSSCEHCVIKIDDIAAVPTDSSCATRPWGDSGAVISLRFHGACAACDPHYDTGCFLEEIYASTDCNDWDKLFQRLAILADGKCHPVSSSNFYQVHCNGEGKLVGKGNCNTSSCEHCMLDIDSDPLPTDESCSLRPWGGDQHDDVSLRFYGKCAVCQPDVDAGCFREEVFDGSGCDQEKFNFKLAVLADGGCHPIQTGLFYTASCNNQGFLVGKSMCNTSSCEHCEMDISTDPIATNNDCNTPTWGNDFSLRMQGHCALCQLGTAGCIHENIYHSATDCSGAANAVLAIKADGSCVPISNDMFYAVTCNADHTLTGVSQCNSSDCSHCLLDVSDPLPADGTCQIRPFGGQGENISLVLTGSCPAASPSHSPSVSRSPAASPSKSPSGSATASVSSSPSLTASLSPSPSPIASKSVSSSQSPSAASPSTSVTSASSPTGCATALNCSQCAERSSDAYNQASCTVDVQLLTCVWCQSSKTCVSTVGVTYTGKNPVGLDDFEAFKDVKEAYKSICGNGGVGGAVVSCLAEIDLAGNFACNIGVSAAAKASPLGALLLALSGLWLLGLLFLYVFYCYCNCRAFLPCEVGNRPCCCLKQYYYQRKVAELQTSFGTVSLWFKPE
eukprot:g64017.t1